MHASAAQAVVLLSLVFTLPTASAYKLQTTLSGNGLLNAFNFQAGNANNGGVAYYNSLAQAKSKGLVSVDKNGAVTLKVSTKEKQGMRDSMSLFSKATYGQGVYIFDVAHMPTGCGLWPSIWMTGPNWPQNGEIDIIEGVHHISQNSMSTHTGAGCMQQTSGFTGSFMMNGNNKNNCNVHATNAQGCGVRSSSKTSYGAPFNSKSGGVYALVWDNSGLRTYHFLRNAIPGDIHAGKPNPAKWGTPENFVHASSCSLSHFKNMMLVINTNLCGTWGSGVWSQDLSYAGGKNSCAKITGHRSCEDFVRNSGSSFSQGYWKINSIKHYV